MSQVTKPILLDETGQAINATLRGIYGKMSGTDISDGDVEAGDMLLGKIGYNADGKVVGTIPTKAASDVTASDNTVAVPAGYYTEAVTKTVGTKKTAQTYTPGTADQTIASGQYLSGAQTIKGDANLLAENIAKDVTIFGVTGTFEGGTDVSDTTARANDVLSGKVFYLANGTKATGSIPSRGSNDVSISENHLYAPSGYYIGDINRYIGNNISAATITPGTTDQIIAANSYLAGAQTIKGDANLLASNIKKNVVIFGVAGTYEGGEGGVGGGNANVLCNRYGVNAFTGDPITIPATGYYFIFAHTQGYSTPVVKINNISQPLTYSYGSGNTKVWYYAEKVYLAAGDTVEISAFNSSRFSIAQVIQAVGESTVYLTFGNGSDDDEISADFYIKFNDAPTSASDWDYHHSTDGGTESVLADKTSGSSVTETIEMDGSVNKTIPAVTAVYVWGSGADGQYTSLDIDGVETQYNSSHTTYDTALFLPMVGNMVIKESLTTFQGSYD